MFCKALRVLLAVSLTGMAALSSGAEDTNESAALAQSGIRMSEWGRETRLPEFTSSARTKIGGKVELSGLGAFLSEELNTLGAGATNTESLRKMLANRAIGREDDSLMSFMSSRWESAPGRLANFLTDYGESRLNALPGVENAELGLDPDGENGFGFSASGVGMLHRDLDSGFGLQPKIEKSGADGKLFGSFGAFQRHALGDWAVAGVNIFADYANHPTRGDASRFRVGADFQSAWVDADIRRFIGGEGGRYRTADGRLFRAYAPHGTAAEIRMHSPHLRWLEGFAEFSELEGRGGNADTRTHGFGLAYQPHYGPLAGLRANAQFNNGKDAEVNLAYAWTLGRGADSPATAERFNVYTEIANPVPGGEFDPSGFRLYEGVHLYELQQNNLSGGITLAQLSTRISLMWNKIPPYLRISEEHRSQCPPPVIVVSTDHDRWWRWYRLRSGMWATWDQMDKGRFAGLTDDFGDAYNYGGYCTSILGNLDVNSGVDEEGELCDSDDEDGCEPYRDTYGDFPLEQMIGTAFSSLAVDTVRLMVLAGADMRRINSDNETVMDTLQDYYGRYTAKSNTSSEIAQRLKDMATIMVVNGVSCSEGETTGDICGMTTADIDGYDADSDDWRTVAQVRAAAQVTPDDGDMSFLSGPKVVVEGNAGIVAELTVETNYADYDLHMQDDSGHFAIEDKQIYAKLKGKLNGFNGRLHISCLNSVSS